MGPEAFSAENEEAELKKYEKRLLKRRVLLRIQLATSQKSVSHAFNLWKEETVMQLRKERARQLAAENRERSDI